MKNMKKLLGLMAALGLATTATLTTVACGDAGTKTNDLTKAFKETYVAKSSLIAKLGVAKQAKKVDKVKGAKDETVLYDFTKDNLDDATLKLLVKPTGQKITDITKAEPTGDPGKADLETAYYHTENQKGLTADKAGKINFKITLDLYKSVVDDKDAKTFKWVSQNTSMTVTIAVMTGKIDLSALKDATVTGVKPMVVDGFKTELVNQLNLQSGFESLQLADVIITKDGTNDFKPEDIITTPELAVKVVAKSADFDKDKAITVNLTVADPVSLDGLKDTADVSDVTKNDVDSFTTELFKVLVTQDNFNDLTAEHVTLTKDGKALDKADIKDGELSIKVSAKDNDKSFKDSKTITVTLTTKPEKKDK